MVKEHTNVYCRRANPLSMDYNKCDNDEENITYLHVFKVNGLKDL